MVFGANQKMKRFIGTSLSILGSPFLLVFAGFYSSLQEKYPWKTLIFLPLTIITSPLIPFALIGSNFIRECDEEKFHKETKHLPRVHSPKEYASIDFSEGSYWVDPFYYTSDLNNLEGEYATEEEARTFLKSKGYYEAIDADRENHSVYGTLWVKD